jgi:preprotein translocase subunit SecG
MKSQIGHHSHQDDGLRQRRNQGIGGISSLSSADYSTSPVVSANQQLSVATIVVVVVLVVFALLLGLIIGKYVL